jgi:hypothetical protein
MANNTKNNNANATLYTVKTVITVPGITAPYNTDAADFVIDMINETLGEHAPTLTEITVRTGRKYHAVTGLVTVPAVEAPTAADAVQFVRDMINELLGDHRPTFTEVAN